MAEKTVTVQSPQDFSKINESIYGEESVHMKDFVIGALVGGIVGAAAALLLAPKAGSELRNDVAIQAVTLKDKSVELSGTAKEKTTQLVEKVKAKTAKQPPAFDDGTVSSEGEEPLEENMAEGVTEVAEEVQSFEDFENSTRHSSIE
jgi:gas vesicle protein